MGLADAHRAVLDARETLEQGSDPAADAQREKAERQAMPTVAEFADEYIERYAKPTKKSWREDKRILQREIVPELGKLRLDEIHRRDIVRVLDAIKDRGAPAMATHTLAVTRRMFGFAIERGVLDLTPVQYIKTPKAQARSVTLTDEAIRHLWAATVPYGESELALPMHHATRMAMRLLLVTGQRSAEVAGIELSEIDTDKRLWTIPGARTKNGLDQTVPLSNMALDAVSEAMQTAGKRYLFATNSKTGHLTKWGNVQAMERLFTGWEPRYRTHELAPHCRHAAVGAWL